MIGFSTKKVNSSNDALVFEICLCQILQRRFQSSSNFRGKSEMQLVDKGEAPLRVKLTACCSK